MFLLPAAVNSAAASVASARPQEVSVRVRLVRALVLPLLVLGVSGYAVQRAAQLSEEPPAPADEPLPPPEPLGPLWSAWGEDLAPDAAGYPVELAVLERGEALYVLLTVRAAQVAEAVASARPGADVTEAIATSGLAPQPAEVPAASVPQQPGCVVLTYADEPFGRSYFGWSQAAAEPGPSPLSALEERLLRVARVGLSPTDAATCGVATAYSPLAQKALLALDPELL